MRLAENSKSVISFGKVIKRPEHQDCITGSICKPQRTSIAQLNGSRFSLGGINCICFLQISTSRIDGSIRCVS
jgi:hypothetical protein